MPITIGSPRGETGVDSLYNTEEKIFEDIRANPGEKAFVFIHSVPFEGSVSLVNLLTSTRLVRKGFRVAVVEQVEDPKKAKGLVRREVVRVVSPGTLTDAGYLEAREPAFLLALAPVHPGPGFGVALLDLSTGEFTTAEYSGEDGRAANDMRQMTALGRRIEDRSFAIIDEEVGDHGFPDAEWQVVRRVIHDDFRLIVTTSGT